MEDFARLSVCGLPQLPPSQGYTVTLTMSPSSGSPAINLYAAFTNGADYLTSPGAASNQFTRMYLGEQLVFDYSRNLGTISASQSYSVPLRSDGTPQYTNFLFDGASIGAGQLTLTLSQTTAQGSNVLAQTSAWLDLHDIKDFYERAIVTNSTSGAITNWASSVQRVEYAVLSEGDEAQDLIVLVHGFNVDDWRWANSSETVFKRFYWAGYHGRLATVHWPAITLSWSELIDNRAYIFNQSELQAYKASGALTTYLNQSRARLPGHRLHLVVHSQGSAGVSEAVEQGAPFDTWILTQGAMPASSYDANAPTNASLVAYEVFPSFTPEWQPMGYHGAYTNLTGRIVNFYNSFDPVLDWWVYDQQHFKPSSNYYYDGTNTTRYVAPPYVVTDPQESRSMVSRSRSLPVGQTGPASAHGVIESAVDLRADFGFYNAFPDDHSAQWTWPIQTTRPYYLQVLESTEP